MSDGEDCVAYYSFLQPRSGRVRIVVRSAMTDRYGLWRLKKFNQSRYLSYTLCVRLRLFALPKTTSATRLLRVVKVVHFDWTSRRRLLSIEMVRKTTNDRRLLVCSFAAPRVGRCRVYAENTAEEQTIVIVKIRSFWSTNCQTYATNSSVRLSRTPSLSLSLSLLAAC